MVSMIMMVAVVNSSMFRIPSWSFESVSLEMNTLSATEKSVEFIVALKNVLTSSIDHYEASYN